MTVVSTNVDIDVPAARRLDLADFIGDGEVGDLDTIL